MESKGTIRGIIEEGETMLVSFPKHDGYFRVADPTLKERVRKAHREQQEISFSFDRELRITLISPAA